MWQFGVSSPQQPQGSRCRGYGWLAGIALVLAVYAFAVATPHASARSARGGSAQFALAPVYYDSNEPDTQAYFIFDAAPERVIHSQVRITNTGTAAGTARLYAVDATTGQTSGTVYRSSQDARQEVGAWLTLDAATVTLAPGAARVVSFSLLVPEGARPGQHVGGIVAEPDIQMASNPQSAFQVNVQNLTIVGVLVNLPGERVDRLEASGVSVGGRNDYQTLTVGLSNAGNSLLKPYGELTVDDAHGKQLYQLSLKLDTLLPMTSIEYPVYLSGPALVPGAYTVRLMLEYGDPPQTLVYTTSLKVDKQQVTQVFGAHRTTTPPSDLLSELLGGDETFLGETLVGVGALAGVLFLLGLFIGHRRSVRKAKRHARRSGTPDARYTQRFTYERERYERGRYRRGTAHGLR